MAGQGARRGKQLLDGLHPNHTRTTHQGIKHGIGTDQGTGMRLHRLGPRLVTAHLEQDDGLDPRRGTQGAHEAARITDPLDVHQDALGRRIVGQIVEDLAKINISRGPTGNDAGKTNAIGLGPIQHRRAQGTRLRDQGQIAAQRNALAKGRVQPNRRPLDAQAIGADKTDAVFTRNLQHPAFQGQARRPYLAEPRRQDQGATNPVVTEIVHDRRDRRRRRGDNG